MDELPGKANFSVISPKTHQREVESGKAFWEKNVLEWQGRNVKTFVQSGPRRKCSQQSTKKEEEEEVLE